MTTDEYLKYQIDGALFLKCSDFSKDCSKYCLSAETSWHITDLSAISWETRSCVVSEEGLGPLLSSLHSFALSSGLSSAGSSAPRLLMKLCKCK